VTAAATGQGVAELLSAIDPHRGVSRAGQGEAVRLRRAEEQVWAVLVDRLHDRVRSLEDATSELGGAEADPVVPAAGQLLRAVAAHEIDPYAAADAILRRLMGSAGTN
jgi:putative protein kinase ArgK-like GTPase of G3E family